MDADAIEPAAAAAPGPGTGTDAGTMRSPDTTEIAHAIMAHPFPLGNGTDGNDDVSSRGPGDPNYNPHLVLPNTGLGGDRCNLSSQILQFFLDENRDDGRRKKDPFKSKNAAEQLDILSQKMGTIIEALGSAGESFRNTFTSWVPSTPSTAITPGRRTRSKAAAAAVDADTDTDANGRTPKATNRRGGAEAPVADHPTSFKITQIYAALSALFSCVEEHLLDNLRGRSNANLRKVVSDMTKLFEVALFSAEAVVGMESVIRIGPKLGEGTFGEVYRAILTTAFGKEKTVAVKIFKISDEQTIEIINEEIRLLLVMGSFPHFPAVIDHIVTPLFACMVMDFMDGGILDDMDRQLSEEELLTYFRQIIACLMVMHAKDACHRDIKPENVGLMTDAVGNLLAQLLDLGLGRLRAKEATTWAGTPDYMAPEVAAGNDKKNYDGLVADIWSTAVTLLELAVSADAFNEIKKSRRSDGSFDPSLIKQKIQEAGLSKEFANLAIWMLNVDPTKRPSPLQAYGHAAFVGMESLFESKLKDWDWVPAVLQDKKIKQQQAATIASLEGRIVRIQSEHDRQLSEVAGRATAAEAALATAEAALAAAGDAAAAAADPNAAAAAGGDAGQDVDGANPGEFTASERAIVRDAYNTVSSENPDFTDNAKFLAVVDRLNGHITFPCTFERVKDYITQGDPTKRAPTQILTEARIRLMNWADSNRACQELKDFKRNKYGPTKKLEVQEDGAASNHGRLLEFFPPYW